MWTTEGARSDALALSLSYPTPSPIVVPAGAAAAVVLAAGAVAGVVCAVRCCGRCGSAVWGVDDCGCWYCCSSFLQTHSNRNHTKAKSASSIANGCACCCCSDCEAVCSLASPACLVLCLSWLLLSYCFS